MAQLLTGMNVTWSILMHSKPRYVQCPAEYSNRNALALIWRRMRLMNMYVFVDNIQMRGFYTIADVTNAVKIVSLEHRSDVERLSSFYRTSMAIVHPKFY